MNTALTKNVLKWNAVAVLLVYFLCSNGFKAHAQSIVEYKYEPFSFIEDSMKCYIDSTLKLGIYDIVKPEISKKFRRINPDSLLSYDKNVAYWLKVNLIVPNYIGPVLISKPKYIKKIDFYYLNENGEYVWQKAGAYYPLEDWAIKEYSEHYFIIYAKPTPQTIYFRMESDVLTGIGQFYFGLFEHIAKLKHLYFYTGIFIGILVVALCVSCLLFLWLKDTVYLYYFCFLVNFGLFNWVSHGNIYELIGRGVEFRNDFYTIPYGLMSIFFMLYVNSFIKADKEFPFYKKVMLIAIALRLLFLVMPFFNDWIDWRSSEWDLLFLVPSIYICTKAYISRNTYIMPLMGSMMLVTIASVLHSFRINILPYIEHRSYSIVGVFEILVFLVSLALRFRQTKAEKEMALTEALYYKDQVNSSFEEKVKERTEVIEKLTEKLKSENIKLEEGILNVSKARVGQTSVSYDEFKNIYPDDESVYLLIDKLKSQSKFVCSKCGNEKFSKGTLPYSKKCTKCKTVESIQAGTVFFGIKFSINKALFILVSVNSGKEIPATELSKMLDLRLQTCWQFKIKVAERIKQYQEKKIKVNDWKDLIINSDTK